MSALMSFDQPPLLTTLSVNLNPLAWSTASYLIAISLLLLLRATIPSGRRWYASLGREMLIITPAVFLYFAVRGVVGGREEDAVRNAESIVRLQTNMGIFHEPTLQGWILDSEILTRTVNWIYIWGHWPVVVGTLIWMIVRHPDDAGVYRNAFLISGTIAMFVFALFPVAPPRLVPELAVIDTITEQSRAYRVLQPPALTNQFAAMPSLHFGWNLLMGIAIVRHARIRALRVFGYLMPVMMFLGIVLTANHYILDGVAGGALVVASLWFTTLLSGEPSMTEPEREKRETPPIRLAMHRNTPAAVRHPLQTIDTPITIAHRAGNSILLARTAEAAGTDVIEADIWLHRDRLEVRHSKTLGPVPIRWDRWWVDLRPAPCLELSELLESISLNTRVMLDLKGRNPALPERLLAESRRVRPEIGILVCSQNWNMLARLQDEPDVSTVYSIGNRRQLAASWDMLEHEGIDAVSIHTRLLNPETVRRLRERVPVIITWPINNRPAYDRVRELRVDGVISDSPSILEEIASEKPVMGMATVDAAR